MLFDCHISYSSRGHIFSSIVMFCIISITQAFESMTVLKEAPMLQVVFVCMTVEKT